MGPNTQHPALESVHTGALESVHTGVQVEREGSSYPRLGSGWCQGRLTEASHGPCQLPACIHWGRIGHSEIPALCTPYPETSVGVFVLGWA